MKLQDATPGTHGVLTLGETRIVGTVGGKTRKARPEQYGWQPVPHWLRDRAQQIREGR